MSEAKHGLRASLDSEMAALGDASEESLAALKASSRPRKDIGDIDHTVHTFTAYDLSYNFLSQ